MLRVGIDTGGTFTDVVVWQKSGLRVHKVPSTPRDPGAAVLNGLCDVRDDAEADVVHGTTVGLNAVLTGNVARTAFVTNAGFEDLIEIGRQVRDGLYDLAPQHAVPPVPRTRRFAVSSRRSSSGDLLQQPSAKELANLRARLAKAKVEAIAIGLLHSYAHPEDEHAIARALERLGVPITCSADLLPVHGEYERFVAAIINAAIRPIMGTYVGRLSREVAPGVLRLMRSSGGIMDAAEAQRFPARAVFSGPAGGVLAVRQLARVLKLGTVAGLDMGGTSADVSLVTPHAEPSDARSLGGLPLAVPTVDVHTIGCGGGSIASIDAGGALRVGPESAGADPGPACYGRGDEPTITDAHMVLGHMGADTLLAGSFPVDPELSVRAVKRLGKRLGLNLRRTALGILEVADVAMMRALLVITVERAVDPATIPLIAFGGAGGLHAASLMGRLQMPRAVVPAHPGAFSAVGLALAGMTHEVTQPVLRPLQALTDRQLRAMTRELTRDVTLALKKSASDSATHLHLHARLRFVGQGRGLWIATRAAGNTQQLATSFRREHQRLYGFLPASAPIEVVELRARGEQPERRLSGAGTRGARAKARPRLRRSPPAGGAPPWPVYHRDDLAPGQSLMGPCIIEEPTGAVVVPKGTSCLVDRAGLVLKQRAP